ncbi:MAG: small nuclear ribonucleoprotein [Thermoplasmata archaeon]|nr:MAG: small nuclear ribonucleoprotein [Thermoplasmata archaeon]
MKPLEMIHNSLEKRVIVELRGGKEYRGILEGYDHPHLNLILRNAEEIIDGEKKREVEKVIVRGDNIIYISP